jgi:hypothetical protein
VSHPDNDAGDERQVFYRLVSDQHAQRIGA